MKNAEPQRLKEAKKRKIMGKIIVKCWTDSKFKSQFLEDPATCLKEYGMLPNENEKFIAHENTPTKKHLIILRKVYGDLNYVQYGTLAKDAARIMTLRGTTVEQRTKLVLKCWTDPDFIKELRETPVETLKQIGIDIPDDLEIVVIVNENDETHLVLPRTPRGTLTIEDLNKAAHKAGRKRFGYSELPQMEAESPACDPGNTDPDHGGTDSGEDTGDVHADNGGTNSGDESDCDPGDSDDSADSDICCLCICA